MTSVSSTQTPLRSGQQVRCDKCGTPHQGTAPYPSRCAVCNARVGFYVYDPPAKPLDKTELALPDDVTCMSHPAKRATEICEGTGSYICALCAVTIGDKTYSADFINSGGLEKLKKGDIFERKLQRPDQLAVACGILALLLSTTLVGGPILLVMSGIYYFRHLKMKKQNKLYDRVTGVWVNIVLPIYLVIATIALLIIGVLFVSEISS